MVGRVLRGSQMSKPARHFELFARSRARGLVLPLSLAGVALVLAVWSWVGADLQRSSDWFGLSGAMLTRRLRGLIEAVAIGAVVVLAALVMVRKFAWVWLIPAIAVGALLTARVVTPPRAIPAVGIDLSDGLTDDGSARGDEPAIAVQVGRHSVAVPISLLVDHPSIVLSDFESRVLLIANLEAGRVSVLPVDLSIKAADLEAIGSIDGATMLYNRRFAQFLIGMTGQMPEGGRPAGVGTRRVPVWTTVGEWRLRQRDAIVLPAGRSPAPPVPADAVAVIEHDDKIFAIPPQLLPAESHKPMNTQVGPRYLLLVRDEAGRLHAYDRAVEQDLFVRLERRDDPRGRPRFFDLASGSAFGSDMRAIEGELKDKRLARVPIEPAVSLAILRRWYPNVTLTDLP